MITSVNARDRRKFPTARETGIMVAGMMISALSALLLLGLQGEPAEAAAKDRWKVEAELEIVRQGDAWLFVVSGTSTLPTEAVLKTRVYALDIVDDPRIDGGGKRVDEEPMIWEGDEDAGQPAFRTVKAVDGTFRSEVYRFVREPWAIPYRARVIYEPNLQEDSVYKEVGLTEPASWFADLRYRTPADFRDQLRERSIEVREDLMELEALFTEFKKTFFAQRDAYDEEKWKAWKSGWFDRVERLNERNKLRYGMWVVWLERQAKMRVGGMCALLRSLLSDASDELAKAEDFRPVTRERLDGLFGYLEEAIEVCGVHIPLPVDKVRPVMAAYEKGFAPVRERILSGRGAWAEIRGPARRTCVGAIMELLPLLENRKRGYAYVNELANRFTVLVRGADRGAADEKLKAALEAHDQALRVFKDFAGLE